jgi:hypothetical protein
MSRAVQSAEQAVIEAARKVVARMQADATEVFMRDGVLHLQHQLSNLDVILQSHRRGEWIDPEGTPTEVALDRAVRVILEHKGVNILNSLLKHSGLSSFIDERVRPWRSP